MIRHVTIIVIFLLTVQNCSGQKGAIGIPATFFKDSLVLDTTFLFEITPDFYTTGDMLYGSQVALIKPGFKLKESNYLSYKSSTINFIYSSENKVDYAMQKTRLNITANTDSLVFLLTDTTYGKLISLGKKGKHVLLERKMKVKCFFLTANSAELILDPASNRPIRYENIVYYGISEILDSK
jgi:hypothetical protein